MVTTTNKVHSQSDQTIGISSKYRTTTKQKFKRGKPVFDYWRIFKMDVPTLFAYLQFNLFCMYDEVIYGNTTDYLYAKGDIPILLVAHMDTVHKKLPRVEQDIQQNILWSKTGIGADDRAGIAAILRILKDGYRPHVLFTDGEECGCLGAKVAVKELPAPEVNYIIQLDRKGSIDSVYYDNDNDKFEEYVNSFGFKTAMGSFSDISALCPIWGISGVNLSIGYYSAHSDSEYLKINEWESTVKKVKQMLDSPPTEFFEYIEKPYSYGLFNENYGANIAIDKIGVSLDITAEDFAGYFGGDTETWENFLDIYGDFIIDDLMDKVLEAVYEHATDLCPDEFYML